MEEADHKETTRPRSQLEIQSRDDTNVQEQMRQANRQNWNKKESLSRAVPKAGQQQQECRIHFVQEHWRHMSYWSHPPMAGGRGRRSGWCQGSGMGRRSLAGICYMSCRSGKDSDLQRALGMVSPVVDISRGEPEDNGKDEGSAVERK